MKKSRSKRKSPSEPEPEASAMDQVPMMSEELWPAIAGVLNIDTNIRLKGALIKLEIGKPVVVTVTQEAVSGAKDGQ